MLSYFIIISEILIGGQVPRLRLCLSTSIGLIILCFNFLLDFLRKFMIYYKTRKLKNIFLVFFFSEEDIRYKFFIEILANTL